MELKTPPPCDSITDSYSLSIFQTPNIPISLEVRHQMIENPDSDIFYDHNVEICHLHSQRKFPQYRDDPDNVLYLSRFYHEYFDGISTVPKKTPKFLVQYCSHDEKKVDLPLEEDPQTTHRIRKHRTVVRVIFISVEACNRLSKYLKDGSVQVDERTYELELFFHDGTKAKVHLDHKADQTRIIWAKDREEEI